MNLRIVALILQFIINCWPKSNIIKGKVVLYNPVRLGTVIVLSH